MKNGIVVKNGSLFANVRAAGTGLFPNNSNHAVTVDRIQLNFAVTYYNLSFDLNGATGIAVANPTREGFTFKSWNTDQTGKGAIWEPGTTSMPARDIILYAQWEANEKSFSENNNTGKISANGLPKTGGDGLIILSGLGLLIGCILIARGKIKIK